MVIYRIHSDLEQLSHKLLGQPQGLIFKTALDAGAPVFGLVEDKF
jgi:hypothetical protein